MKNDTAYVWVDGNRRISVYKNITRNSVTALFFDLTSKKTIDFILEETERWISYFGRYYFKTPTDINIVEFHVLF